MTNESTFNTNESTFNSQRSYIHFFRPLRCKKTELLQQAVYVWLKLPFLAVSTIQIELFNRYKTTNLAQLVLHNERILAK